MQLDAKTHPDMFPRQLWVLRAKAEEVPHTDEWAGKVKAVVKVVKVLNANMAVKMDAQDAEMASRMDALDAKVDAQDAKMDAKMDAILTALQLLSSDVKSARAHKGEPEPEPDREEE